MVVRGVGLNSALGPTDLIYCVCTLVGVAVKFPLTHLFLKLMVA